MARPAWMDDPIGLVGPRGASGLGDLVPHGLPLGSAPHPCGMFRNTRQDAVKVVFDSMPAITLST